MTVTQYVGARYVPIFADAPWSSENVYEPLTIVQYQGNSFTSRQAVPAGIDINNTEYWAETGNYNAQVEAYRQEVLRFDGRITANANAIASETNSRISADNEIEGSIETLQNRIIGVESGLTTESSARQAADIAIEQDIDDIEDAIADLQTAKNYIGIIGDSFSTSGSGTYWPAIIANSTEWKVLNYAANGAGFTTGTTRFAEQLRQLKQDPNFDKCAHIIVYGGVNDWNDAHSSVYNMMDAITFFYDIYYQIPKENRPAIHFCFGNIGYANIPQYNGYYNWYNQIIKNMQDSGYPGVVEFVPYWHFCTSSPFNADNLHPSQKGHYIIASYVTQILNGTYTGVHRVQVFDNLQFNGSHADGKCTITFDNGTVGFGIRTTAYTPFTPADNTFYDFGDVTGGASQFSLMIGTDTGNYPNIWQTSTPIIMAIDGATNNIGILRAIFNCSNLHYFYHLFGSAAGFAPDLSIPNDLQISMQSNPNVF